MGVAFREITNEYRASVSWESLNGIAAVDGNNTLYQFLTIIRQPDGTPLMDERGRITSHLSGILFRIQNLRGKGIFPFFTFDGKPPDIKRDTIARRHNIRVDALERWSEAKEKGNYVIALREAGRSSRVDDEIVSSAKRLLTLMGIPFVQAPSEGEAQAACMVSRGDAKYVVSQDYDTLLFGSPVLVRNLATSGKRKLHGKLVNITPEKIVLTDLLMGLGITREQLIEIAILIGTDFNSGVPGIGPKKGLKIVKNGDFNRWMRDNSPDTECASIKEFFFHPPVSMDYQASWGEPDREAVLQMLCEEYGFAEERVTKVINPEKGTPGQKTLESWIS